MLRIFKFGRRLNFLDWGWGREEQISCLKSNENNSSRGGCAHGFAPMIELNKHSKRFVKRINEEHWYLLWKRLHRPCLGFVPWQSIAISFDAIDYFLQNQYQTLWQCCYWQLKDDRVHWFSNWISTKHFVHILTLNWCSKLLVIHYLFHIHLLLVWITINHALPYAVSSTFTICFMLRLATFLVKVDQMHKSKAYWKILLSAAFLVNG